MDRTLAQDMKAVTDCNPQIIEKLTHKSDKRELGHKERTILVQAHIIKRGLNSCKRFIEVIDSKTQELTDCYTYQDEQRDRILELEATIEEMKNETKVTTLNVENIYVMTNPADLQGIMK